MEADLNRKPKLQLRSGLSFNGDKTPSPATKLLLSHGKPNFTIPRTGGKSPQDDGSPSSPVETNNNVVNGNANNNYYAYKSANSSIYGSLKRNNNNIINTNGATNGYTNNGTLKRNDSGSMATNAVENEAAKVVLRRSRVATPEPAPKSNEEEDVPEFIRRQRRIQERLAKENILDFDKRRSGYFTHFVLSPNKDSRTSFAETMSSPAVVPSLEMPNKREEEEKQKAVEQVQEQTEDMKKEQLEETAKVNGSAEAEKEQLTLSNGHKVEEEVPTNGNQANGHASATAEEEAEVAQAIEEMNKAVAGEPDDVEEKQEENVEATAEAQVTKEDAQKIEQTAQDELKKANKTEEVGKAEEAGEAEEVEVVKTKEAEEVLKTKESEEVLKTKEAEEVLKTEETKKAQKTEEPEESLKPNEPQENISTDHTLTNGTKKDSVTVEKEITLTKLDVNTETDEKIAALESPRIVIETAEQIEANLSKNEQHHSDSIESEENQMETKENEAINSKAETKNGVTEAKKVEEGKAKGSFTYSTKKGDATKEEQKSEEQMVEKTNGEAKHEIDTKETVKIVN